jgi:hypothetical protein
VHTFGSDKQMFGDEQQIPHGEQSDEEADCHERLPTGERPRLVGKARAGCSVWASCTDEQPTHMENYYEEVSTCRRCRHHSGRIGAC